MSRWFPKLEQWEHCEDQPRASKKYWLSWDCRSRSSQSAIRMSFPADNASASASARALAAEPPILLMDEPFGALDPITRAELQHGVQEAATEARQDHCLRHTRLGEALLLGDRIALMEDGNPAAFSARRNSWAATNSV